MENILTNYHMMRKYQIEQGLNALYKDIERINGMDEKDVCARYNVDSKEEIVEVIQEEIENYESLLSEIEDYEPNYEKTADKPFIVW
ncbi:hypothetical protein [Bacteroides pyogenes]|uniref:hypothetical protein n=1 Tax=Bacteroides pyogenes TaxID=310300 RepID=UPI001BA643E3|nr:hypothetical protein [Bacteroides pyogenes]MBR8738301.1 hypothetical protein [Bacteroides pyogenes]MBR8753915.1 hypothetical protein [Bacteroides pyogenes]MBR8808709.1 hypothetical protein [Bacteroides pyogenes]